MALRTLHWVGDTSLLLCPVGTRSENPALPPSKHKTHLVARRLDGGYKYVWVLDMGVGDGNSVGQDVIAIGASDI